MSKKDNIKWGFAVEVVYGDALEYEADVLAVKDTPQFSGVDVQITHRMKAKNLHPEQRFLEDGSYLISGQQVTRAKQVLYTSTDFDAYGEYYINYTWLRKLGRRFLENLWEAGETVRHLAMTIHGPGLGLDEIESFRSLLLGLTDAYAANHFPPSLERVTFVDRNEKRVQRLREALQHFLSSETPPAAQFQAESSASHASMEESAEATALIAGPESFEPEFRKPAADETTPYVFVAMPFKDRYDDQFYLAIQPCVKEAGFLCERMDLEAFTGDIVDRMFGRIRTARLMIALLDGGNPNVYLEVGYAWGVKTHTVLMAHKEELLPFDVRGHRVLIYDKIYQLKEMLKAELERLLE
jgi:hypothetical protein